MASLKSISSSQVFLAMTMTILTILVSSSNANGDNQSPFCSKTDVGPERELCLNLVKGAKTWDEALRNVVISIKSEAKKATPIFEGLPKHLPATLQKMSKESISETCKESFQSVFYNLNQVLQNIQSGDPMDSIDTELSAALSSLSDCTDGLNEFGVQDPEVSKAKDTVQKFASISLAVSSTKNLNN